MEKAQNRKRTRDLLGEEKRESHKGKKPESVSSMDDDSSYNDRKHYEFSDGIGVFDFPWLKEGRVMFKADEYLEPEEKLAPCSYLDDRVPGTFSSNLDQSCVPNSVVSPAAMCSRNFHDKELDDDRFLQVDDLETVDCIWSCVIDQPLDVGLISKG